MKIHAATGLIIVTVLAGCATADPGPDLYAMQARYENWIAGIPLPKSDDERVSLCRNLRVEIAKQRSAGESASDTTSTRAIAADVRMRSGRNVALLESKASEAKCSGF